MQAGRGHRQWSSFACEINREAAGVHMVTLPAGVPLPARVAPHRANFNFTVARACHFRGLAALFFYVSLDHLRSDARGQIPVLAFFQQGADDDLRIAPRFDSGEPSVVFEFGFALLTDRSSCLFDRSIRGKVVALGAVKQKSSSNSKKTLRPAKHWCCSSSFTSSVILYRC